MKKHTSIQPPNLEDFIKITKKDLEEKIADMISDEQIVSILAGGKRLRSLLALLSFKTCTQGEETPRQYQKALEGGVVIEIAHAASLVHDDIIDNDKERRGKPALYVKAGVANAILTGHKMLIMGFKIALKHGGDWVNLYVGSWEEIVNGEHDELRFNIDSISKKGIPSKSKIFEIYKKIITLKTAALFSSACKAGAIEGNKSDDIIQIFEDYGREIGLAYQLADDLVDLANGEMIDSVVLPLLNRLEDNGGKINVLKKRKIKKEFAKKEDKIKEVYIKEIKEHIQRAKKLGGSKLIPNSHYKSLLAEFPRHVINEMLKEINIAV